MKKLLLVLMAVGLVGCSDFRQIGVGGGLKTDLFPCELTDKEYECNENTTTSIWEYRNGYIFEIVEKRIKKCSPCGKHEYKIYECYKCSEEDYK